MDKFIAALIALCVIFVSLIIGISANAAMQRDSLARQTCIESGGVWSNNICAWSK